MSAPQVLHTHAVWSLKVIINGSLRGWFSPGLCGLSCDRGASPKFWDGCLPQYWFAQKNTAKKNRSENEMAQDAYEHARLRRPNI